MAGVPPYTIEGSDKTKTALLTDTQKNFEDLYAKLDPDNAIGGESDLPARLSAIEADIISLEAEVPSPSGNGLKLMRANSGGTALELASVASILGTSGNGLELLRANSGGTDVEFSPVFEVLGGTGNASKYLKVNSGGTDIEWVTLPTDVVLGFRAGLDLAWASTSSFTLAAGIIEINGVHYSNSLITKTVSSLGNNTFYWIFAQAPGSGTTITSSEITVSSTAPTYDATKRGWYDAGGTKRCLWLREQGWILRTDGSANLLQFLSKEGHYWWDTSFSDVSSAAPSTTWTDYTLTTPPSTIALTHITFATAGVSCALCWRPKGSSSAVGIRTVSIPTASTGVQFVVPVDANRQVQFAFNAATTGTFSLVTLGFFFGG